MSILTDLAVFGGKPTFDEKLHVGRPNIGDRARLQTRIDDLLDRRWLTNRGPYVIELEQKIADFVGVRHCIAMCNATIALEIVIRALGIKGEVIIPSMTFIATAHALQWQEITPVFCDIDPVTHNIDPTQIEKMITPRTTAIIGVHLWGRACNIDALADIAKRHNLRLIFDAAHAFACTYEGKRIGQFGDAEVLSFHATKFFNSLEGGAVVTNDDELARRVRLMQNFGFETYDKVGYIGTNGKMNEISAAMGLTSLESLSEFIETNRVNYHHYQKELAGIPGVSLIDYDEAEECNYQYIVMEVDEAITHISRDHLLEALWAENIVARRYFYPGCHRMEPYKSYFPHAGLLLPHTEQLSERLLSVPTGTAVTLQDITNISSLIRDLVSSGPQIEELLNLRGVVWMGQDIPPPPSEIPEEHIQMLFTRQ